MQTIKRDTIIALRDQVIALTKSAKFNLLVKKLVQRE